jgi:hypothetical protein
MARLGQPDLALRSSGFPRRGFDAWIWRGSPAGACRSRRRELRHQEPQRRSGQRSRAVVSTLLPTGRTAAAQPRDWRPALGPTGGSADVARAHGRRMLEGCAGQCSAHETDRGVLAEPWTQSSSRSTPSCGRRVRWRGSTDCGSCAVAGVRDGGKLDRASTGSSWDRCWRRSSVTGSSAKFRSTSVFSWLVLRR